jgi:hypothetical protein
VRRHRRPEVGAKVAAESAKQRNHSPDHLRIPDFPGFFTRPGTDVMILKIFSPKMLAKKLAFLT